METNQTHSSWPWVMLVARSALFLLFQAAIALILWGMGNQTPWSGSAAWWIQSATLTNLICYGLLTFLYRKESLNYWDIFCIDRKNIKQDLWVMLGVLILAAPIGYLPNVYMSQWLFGSQQAALDLMVRPLPAWAAILGFLFFPLTIGLVEIPTYMIYAMPRLQNQGLPSGLAFGLATLALSFQHIFIPFLPNPNFILYRMTIFLPFAAYMAILLKWRPRLMPYIAVLHAFMDVSIAAMFIPIMIK